MKMAFKISTGILFLSVCIGLTGCYYDTEEELYPDSGVACDTVSVSYETDIKQIFNSNCNECHSGTAAPSVQLNNYEATQTYLNTNKAKFLSSITWDGNASNMPQSSTKMSDCNINTIRAWINAGYPNN
jgi:mono/diheme cytochrome c family protein